MLRRPVLPLLLLLAGSLLAGACAGGDTTSSSTSGPDGLTDDSLTDDSGAATGSCGDGTAVDERDIPYAEIPGVDPDRLSLDLTVPERADPCTALPVVVWVHGGGWSSGDRAGPAAEDKRTLFTDAGWAFASVDYRLSPRPLDVGAPDAVRYPDHNNDVATAVAWLETHAEQYGIDPSRIALLGHSAGAGIVAGVATDPAHLEAAGSDLTAVACTIAIDTESYDVAATASAANPSTARLYQNAFTTDPAVWEQASPLTHIVGNSDLSPFLVVTRGAPGRIEQSTRFVDTLRAEGVDAELLERNPYTHEDVNRLLGRPGDEVMTPPVMAFLDRCLAAPGAPSAA